MPLDLEDILSDVKWIGVEYRGHTFNVAYRPAGISLQRQAEMRRVMRRFSQEGANTDLDESEEMAKVLCETVVDWDLQRKGQRIPFTLEAVKQLPDSIYTAISDAVQADRASDQAEKKLQSARSGAGLPKEARPENARNGIPSSERRDTWA